MFIDYYKLLNVGYTASNEEINQAYDEKISLQDRDSSLTKNLVFDEMKKAYNILSNPQDRFNYNLQLIKKYQKKKSGKIKFIIHKLFKHDNNRKN